MQFIKLHNAYNNENVAVNLDKVLKIEKGYGTSILYFSKKDKLEVNEALTEIFDCVKQIEVNEEE